MTKYVVVEEELFAYMCEHFTPQSYVIWKNTGKIRPLTAGEERAEELIMELAYTEISDKGILLEQYKAMAKRARELFNPPEKDGE